MADVIDISRVAAVPVFAGVDLTHVGPALAHNRLISLNRNEILFHRGQAATGFYFVESGRIRLSITNRHGSTTTVEIIGEGETFGEAVVFLNKPYPVTASALVGSTVLCIGKTMVDEMLRRDERTARRLLANLSMRNHQLIADLAALRLESATARVSSYLLRHIPVPWPPGRHTVLLSDPKRVIADRLSLTPESLSRALRKLSERQLIDVDGPRVIFDPHTLAADDPEL